MCVGVCVYVCVCERVCACVCVCVWPNVVIKLLKDSLIVKLESFFYFNPVQQF